MIKNKKAFSLVELLTATAILATLLEPFPLVPISMISDLEKRLILKVIMEN
ncbi:MAG: prepilin-type N-terminal cleavage/methylation domain-containing protein [Bdellovibrionales bacterium]|nr:prepilin-type N-terminal cleavage/methylation domain-containing protein [Bdellovibrionales bacterium]